MTDTFTSSTPPISWAVLDRYLAGECAPEERVAVDRILAGSPNGREILDTVRKTLRGERSKVLDVSATLTGLRSVIQLEDESRRISGWNTAADVGQSVVLAKTLVPHIFLGDDVAKTTDTGAARTLPEQGKETCVQEPSLRLTNSHDTTPLFRAQDDAYRSLPGFGDGVFSGQNGPNSGAWRPISAKNPLKRFAERNSRGLGRETLRGTVLQRVAFTFAVMSVVGLFVGTMWRSASIAPEWGRRYTTKYGETSTLSLRDGSRITLAPQTTIWLASGYGTGSRRVWLRGEAIFDVSSTAGIPFVVQTRLATVRVLGTTFDVRQYDIDNKTNVVVTAGRVSIASLARSKQAATLVAGMAGIIGDSTVQLQDANDVASWAHGKLIFRSTPAAEVLATLTRWYGYQFRIIDSSIVHQTVTLSLSTESSATALATLENILEVDLTVADTVVTLRARRPLVRPSQPSPRPERGASISREVGR